MARIILVAGKGGVGKTTIAAATALAAARRGHRTLALSLDVAHSLSDCFDLGRHLFDQHRGLPFPVDANLDLQEIDVQEEIERHWGDIFQYVAELFVATGVDEVVAEELAIVPGTEDVIALSYLNKYARTEAYDVIVLDAPPTADSLRFVNIYATLNWYAQRRAGADRQLARIAGPLMQRLAEVPLPRNGFYAGVQRLFEDLHHVDQLLTDPSVTTVRLVTNAEKMVVRETQRAYMYFSMYGVTTDRVIVNRLLPAADGYFARWGTVQATYLEQIREYFRPVPVGQVPMFPDEVLGIPSLERVAAALYDGSDPAESGRASSVYELRKERQGYTLRILLPFVTSEALDITRLADEVIVRVGNFKRYVPVPRPLSHLRVEGARLQGAQLVIRFTK